MNVQNKIKQFLDDAWPTVESMKGFMEEGIFEPVEMAIRWPTYLDIKLFVESFCGEDTEKLKDFEIELQNYHAAKNTDLDRLQIILNFESIVDPSLNEVLIKQEFDALEWEPPTPQKLRRLNDLRLLSRMIEVVQQKILQGQKKQPDESQPQQDSGQIKTKRPHNWKGDLSQTCIKKVRAFRKERAHWGIQLFFETVHAKYECCRIAFKENGVREEISWAALRDKIKEVDPDIYYGRV